MNKVRELYAKWNEQLNDPLKKHWSYSYTIKMEQLKSCLEQLNNAMKKDHEDKTTGICPCCGQKESKGILGWLGVCKVCHDMRDPRIP